MPPPPTPYFTGAFRGAVGGGTLVAGFGGLHEAWPSCPPSQVPTHPLSPQPHPLLAGGSCQDILTFSSDFFIWNPYPPMLSLEVKDLSSPQGLTVKGTHIAVPRGVSSGEVLAPSPPPAPGTGGGREDKVGLNRMTFPFKCLL